MEEVVDTAEGRFTVVEEFTTKGKVVKKIFRTGIESVIVIFEDSDAILFEGGSSSGDGFVVFTYLTKENKDGIVPKLYH